MTLIMMVERNFGMIIKKKRNAGPTRVFKCRLDWLHFIHHCCDADHVFFPPLAKAFWNFSWLELALSSTCTKSVAFVTDDDLPARILFLSLSCYFLFTLSIYASFSFFPSLSIFTSHRCNFLFIMYPPVFQASEDQSEFPSCSENQ